MLLYVVGNRVAVTLLCTIVGKFGKIVGLELDSINFIIASETFNHRISLVLWQWVLTILIGSELFIELLFCIFLMPLLLGTEAFGNWEERHDRSVVNTIYLNLIQDLQGVGQGLGHIGEDSVHLCPCLEPLLLRIDHTRRIVEILTRSQAEQMVMSLCRFLILKMTVVGADQFDAILLRELHQHLVHLLLQRIGLAVGMDIGVCDLVTLKL